MDLAKMSAIASISLLGAMSPGPDFAIVTKNCLSGTFRTGFFTALGVASALLVHVSYCLFGIAILIQESPFAFHILKYLGAAYLLYLGIVLLKERTSIKRSSPGTDKRVKTKQRPFVSGFLCNLLNPKATLFVLSLFTQFISPSMSFLNKASLGSIIAIVGFLWFTFLSYLITHRLFQKHFSRFHFVITKTMGFALCTLAFFVAFLS